MIDDHHSVCTNARLVKIGSDVYPVYGDDEVGWSVNAGTLYPPLPRLHRYKSFDELYFALVNLSMSSDGAA